jgi:hypothetical protein
MVRNFDRSVERGLLDGAIAEQQMLKSGRPQQFIAQDLPLASRMRYAA